MAQPLPSPPMIQRPPKSFEEVEEILGSILQYLATLKREVERQL